METLSPWLNDIFRWAHVVAGVLWIGLLYFFNWVNAQVVTQLDAETKQKVLPQLLPRTLYFFRWGAAFTFITGLFLLHSLYHHGYMNSANVEWSNRIIGLAIVLLAPVIYDQLWKFLGGMIAVGLSFAGAVAITWYLETRLGYGSGTTTIHLGAMFGTIMAFNVWMRIWPAQRKIIAATAAGEAPDASLPALAGLRSKHNTYMSVPLIYTMVTAHAASPLFKEECPTWMGLAGVIAVGWFVTCWIYKKSASPATTAY